MRRFKLTTYFVITALLAMSLVTVGMSVVGGRLAEENLVRVTEENTARDAAHIHSMIRGRGVQHEMSMAAPAMQGDHGPAPLTLESIAGPSGLSTMMPDLVDGLNIVKLNVFNLDGDAVWSTDPETGAITDRERLPNPESTEGHRWTA